MFINAQPDYTSHAAVFKNPTAKVRKAIKDEFTRSSTYGETYEAYRVVDGESGPEYWVPINSAPIENDLRVDGTSFTTTSSFVAKTKEQERVVADTVKRLLWGECFVTKAPTGFGKTYVGIEVAHRVGKQTLIVVTKEDIRDQWIEAIVAIMGLSDDRIGLIQGDTFKVDNCPVVIATVQSIANMEKYSPSDFAMFGLCIWDEVHRQGADYFSNSCLMIPAKLRLGLSATPDRKDGKWALVKANIGDVKVSTAEKKLKPKILIRKTKFKLPRVTKKVKGQFKNVPLPHSPGKTGHIAKLLAKDVIRNRMITEFVYAARSKGRYIIIMCDTKAHLKNLQKMFLAAGMEPKEIGFYIGGLSKDERERVKKLPVILATYSYASEATNIPWLDTLVFGTPKSSVEQIIGRILREWEGKKEPVALDLVDSDSVVYTKYYHNRHRFYLNSGAKVVFM